MQATEKAVSMFCQNCGHCVSSEPELFNEEYLCPKCHVAGYFRHTPPIGEPQRKHIEHPPVSVESIITAPAGLRRGQRRAGLALLALGALAAGAFALSAMRGGDTAQESLRQKELAAEYDQRALRALSNPDLRARNAELAALRELLRGSGLPAEKSVSDALIAGLLEENRQRELEIARREERASWLAKDATAAEERINKLAAEISLRERELVEKESRALQILAREDDVRAREQELAQRREQLTEFEKRLVSLEHRLTDQTLKLAEREQALALQQEQINLKIAALEQRERDNTRIQPIIVTSPPAPRQSTSLIIRETVPVYVGNWSWRWPSHHHRPGPRPGPGPHPWPHGGGSGLRIGGSGFSFTISGGR